MKKRPNSYTITDAERMKKKDSYTIRDVIHYLNFSIQDIINENNKPKSDGLFNNSLNNSRFINQLADAYGLKCEVDGVIEHIYAANEWLEPRLKYRAVFEGVVKALLDKSINDYFEINSANPVDLTFEGITYGFRKEELVPFTGFFMKIEGLLKYIYESKTDVHSTLNKSLIFVRNRTSVHQENGRVYYRMLKQLRSAAMLGSGLLARKIADFYRLVKQVHNLGLAPEKESSGALPEGKVLIDADVLKGLEQKANGYLNMQKDLIKLKLKKT